MPLFVSYECLGVMKSADPTELDSYGKSFNNKMLEGVLMPRDEESLKLLEMLLESEELMNYDSASCTVLYFKEV